jgi:HK97 gp10 family phage protein
MPAAQAGGPYGRGDFRFTSYFKQRQQQILDAQARAAERTGAWAAEEARRLAPVDTGELRDSITYEVRRTATTFAIVVLAGADHALYVELGTSRMSAQPYLRPVLDRIGQQYQQFLAEEVRKIAA